MYKLCTKCKTSKHITEFGKDSNRKDILKLHCKDCCKGYYEQNKSRILESQKAYSQTHSEEIKEKKRVYRSNNKKHIADHDRLYYENNKNKIIDRIKYNQVHCLDVRLKRNLRSRLRLAIKNNQKSGSAVRDLGCTVQELKQYLESKFQTGMSWDNWGKTYGKWNIDHIMPLSKFDLSDGDQFKMANHYTNLQPLWFEDNMRKGDK